MATYLALISTSDKNDPHVLKSSGNRLHLTRASLSESSHSMGLISAISSLVLNR